MCVCVCVSCDLNQEIRKLFYNDVVFVLDNFPIWYEEEKAATFNNLKHIIISSNTRKEIAAQHPYKDERKKAEWVERRLVCIHTAVEGVGFPYSDALGNYHQPSTFPINSAWWWKRYLTQLSLPAGFTFEAV